GDKAADLAGAYIDEPKDLAGGCVDWHRIISCAGASRGLSSVAGGGLLLLTVPWANNDAVRRPEVDGGIDAAIQEMTGGRIRHERIQRLSFATGRQVDLGSACETQSPPTLGYSANFLNSGLQRRKPRENVDDCGRVARSALSSQPRQLGSHAGRCRPQHASGSVDQNFSVGHAPHGKCLALRDLDIDAVGKNAGDRGLLDPRQLLDAGTGGKAVEAQQRARVRQIERVEDVPIRRHPVASEEHLTHTEPGDFGKSVQFIEYWTHLSRVRAPVRKGGKSKRACDGCGEGGEPEAATPRTRPSPGAAKHAGGGRHAPAPLMRGRPSIARSSCGVEHLGLSVRDARNAVKSSRPPATGTPHSSVGERG